MTCLASSEEHSTAIALITGAARGLGRALARALAGRGWRSSSTRAAPADLGRRPSADCRDVTASPATSPAPRHRAALAAAVTAIGRLDLLVNNASDLGPSPLPRLADVPLGALRRVLRDQRARAARADPAVPPAAARAGGIVMNVSSDAAVEAYEGWGGVRLVQGRARPADRGARRRGAGPALCTRSTPATCAREMHQAAFPGEDISDRPEPETVVPALLRLIATRPPSGRLRAADLARPLAAEPGQSDPPTEARPRCTQLACLKPRQPSRRRPATASGCSSRRPTAWPTRGSAELGGVPRARRPGRGQHLGHAGRGGRRQAAGRPPGRGALRRRTRRRRLGGRGAPRGRPGRCRRRAGETDLRCPARRSRWTLLRRYPDRGRRPAVGQARLWRARPLIDGGVPPTSTRHGRPIRYAYVPRRGRCAEYQTVFAREPGSAEMPSAGRPFTAELVTDLVTRGVGVAPIMLHTGGPSQEAGEPPQPERFRVPERDRPAGQRHPGGGRARGRGRHHGDPRAGVGGRRGRDGARRRTAGPTSSSARTAPARVVTGLVTGWHAPGRVAPRAARRRRRAPTSSSAAYAEAWPRATGGTSSATAACCCRR